MILELLLAIVVGGVLGLVFSLLGLPIPAPPTLAGVLGVLGIFFGYMAGSYVAGFFAGSG